MAKSSKTEIVTVKAKGANAPALWSPVAGENIQELAHTLVGTSLSEDEFRRIRNESLRILKQCLPPDRRPERRTGLIIGYVQSGKTMSMTTVSALARDNKLRLFIVFAGTKKNLVEQSRFRFTRELRGSSPRLRWEMWSNPTLDEHKQELEVLAEEWDDPQLLEKDQRALFITVMKQHTHLDNLAKLLDTANLSGITALIFDDEADQAGLNTKPQEDQPSTTYRRILRIRQLIPRHTYLQYTATPQAPLLINLMDILSPEFGDVIEPGPMYTGGDHFFIKTPGLVRHIPDEEALDVASEEAVSPPESLLEALRVYFLGVAAARTRRDQGTRSMLIHPSIRQTHHSQFTTWVYEIQQRWRAVLAQNAGDPERKAEVAQFKSAYKSLKETAPSIAPLDDLLPRLRLIGVVRIHTSWLEEPSWSEGLPWKD